MCIKSLSNRKKIEKWRLKWSTELEKHPLQISIEVFVPLLHHVQFPEFVITTGWNVHCCYCRCPVRKKTVVSQHKIVLRTHSTGSLSICQHTPTRPTLFRSPQTWSSIHTKTDTWTSHTAHLSLIGLSVLSSPGSLAVCQCRGSQYHHVNPHRWSHNKLTNTHTGAQVTGEQSSHQDSESYHQHCLSEWKIYSRGC